ncbi:hypothetical protein BJ138DRAFT_1016423 [Hygrophoropsis aurantiaca]|uniref:Uncharacterized protein n=1 Tax=Hygrophoropsis aurantiaca TaxID=72124 RepID=A0ACB8A035_9AGAM|nr:hypothetical protein BJ138DRAFT_1016423 [Hygrophoropsis aurantiaca]
MALSCGHHCRGTKADGSPCDCEVYTAPDNPTPPLQCQECLHGPSLHRPLEVAGSVLPNFPPPPQNTPANTSGSGAGGADMKSVDDMFRKITAGARARAIGPSADSQKATKGTIQVFAWVALINRLKRHGCAQIETDHKFSPTWTHEQVDAYLRFLFPLPFAYLDSLDVKGKSKESKKAIWAILCKQQRKLSVGPEMFPGGRDLKRYKGRNGSGIPGSYVFIGVFARFVVCNGNYLTSCSVSKTDPR